MRREDDLRHLVDRTVERFARLDFAVNNAGTEGEQILLTEHTADTYAATFDTHVLGTVLSLKHELRVTVAQKSGREAAPHGIRVNAVAPGPIDTEMLGRFAGSPDRKGSLGKSLPLGRLGRPEEIAQAIVFLASNNSAFITGEILHVNGGKTAS